MIFLIGNVNFLALTGISHISFQKLRCATLCKHRSEAKNRLVALPKNELLVHRSAWVANVDKRFIVADGWQLRRDFV
jgi:hypothetical protein